MRVDLFRIIWSKRAKKLFGGYFKNPRNFVILEKTKTRGTRKERTGKKKDRLQGSGSIKLVD